MKALLTALGTILFLSGCSKEEPSTKLSQELRTNVTTEPQSLNPTRARALADLNVIRMFHEGLTRIDKDGKPSLAMAERVSLSEDKKTYTFSLREAKWSNGDPVTAHDFVFAIKQALSPDIPSDNAFLLYGIKNAKLVKKGIIPSSLLGVYADDDQTLVIHLDSPIPYFLDLASHPIMFPINQKVAKENPHWAENGETYVGNGPFAMNEWKHNNSITAVKNPTYWDAKNVNLKKISLAMVSEETGLNMFEMNELDWEGSPFSTIPTDAIPSLMDIKTAPSCATCWLRVNVNRAPFDSPLLRKAFALAINRKDILEHVTHGTQQATTALVPMSFGLHEKPLFEDGDVEEARTLFTQYLKESGIKSRKFPEITLTYAMGDRNHKIVQAIQSQWQKVFGITVHLHQVETKVAFTHISNGDYQLALGSWFADVNDPINFLEVFKSKNTGTNNTGWENEEYAQLLDKSYKAEGEERARLLAQSEKIIMSEMPVIPIFNYTMCYIQENHVKDVALNIMGNIDFKWARIEE